MSTAIARIVVQILPSEKKSLVAKAKRFDLTLSELMRRGATAYAAPDQEERDLELLVERVRSSTREAEAALDDALKFVKASNARMGQG
jgi:hypothetical protein